MAHYLNPNFRTISIVFLTLLSMLSTSKLYSHNDTVINIGSIIRIDTIVKVDTILRYDTIIHIDTIASPKVDTVAENSKTKKKNWNLSGNAGINLNQLQLSNWSAGGESSAAGKAFSTINIVYDKNKVQWETIGKFAFGIAGYDKNRLEKTDDKLDVSTSASYKAYKNWTYTFVLSLKTQFANGYKYPNDSTIISGFLAPGYINLSLGYKYKKSDRFELFLSPASGKFTVVTMQELADQGAFGVKAAEYDTAGNITKKGKNIFNEFGINIIANYNQKIGKNIDLSTNLNLYNNYLDSDRNNRWNIDVDWETTVNFTINKRISTILFVHLRYDHNTVFPVYEMIDGAEVKVNSVPKLQFKESLGIGFTYSFT